jgi:hypothetical protein
MPGMFCSRKLVFIVLLFFFSIIAISSSATAKAKRGEPPQCQEECMAGHNVRMKLLSEEYAKTGDKMKYQDDVGTETYLYFQCLTNCRELMPVK